MRKLLSGTLGSITALIYQYSSYEVLSDSQKRSIYDARGEAGLSESGGMGGMDPQVKWSCHSPPSSYQHPRPLY